MDGQGNADGPPQGPPQPEVPGQQLPNQAEMAAIINTLTERTQQLGAEAQVRRLNDAQRQREAGCKAMSRMSKYNGEGAFRTFRLEYTM